MQYEKIAVPKDGRRITINPDASLNVPDFPYIAFIEGDGIGIDITPVMLKVVDAAVAKAYGGKRRISWVEVFAGDKASTIVFPVPMDLLGPLLDAVRKRKD